MGGVAGRVLHAPRADRLAAAQARAGWPRAPARPRPTAAPCRRRTGASALAMSRLGSIRCGAPRSWTHTSTSGQRRTSAPVAPAWSKWMWVSRIRCGGPSRASSRVWCEDSGPGSTRTSSSSKQQITCGLPRWRTSISRGSDTSTGPYNRPHGAPPARARSPVDDAHLRGPFDREAVQRAVPLEPRQGPDGAVDRLRPAHADRLRPRPRARARRGRQGRRPGRPQGRHARAARRHPAGRDEHVDDDQRDRGVAAGALHRHRRGERARPRRRSRARRRTTSSRSSWPAGPTRSRPGPRCG